MGMPISLALRGRHAADAEGRAAWAEVMADLRAADRVFSTYRADSVISRLGRGELALADCPAEVAEVLALGEAAERDSGGAFSVRRPGPPGGGSRPERGGEGLGGRTSGRRPAPWTERTSACRPAATWSAARSTRRRRPGGSGSSTRTIPPG